MAIGFNTLPSTKTRRAGLAENNFLSQSALLDGLRIDGGIQLNGTGQLALDATHDTRISSLTENTMLFETSGLPRLTITDTTLTVDATVALSFAGALTITNATASTTPTTGALIVTGGVGIGGNLHVAGSITGLSAGAGSTTSVLIQANQLVFEGTTANDFETILGIVEPTADRVFSLPDYPSFTLAGYTTAGLIVAGPGEGGVVLATSTTLRSSNITTGGAGNIAGTDLVIGAGLGTGTGDEGTINFQVPIVAGAGDFIQTTANRLILDMAGSTTVLTMASQQAITLTTPAAAALTLAPGTTGVINLTTQTLNQFYAVNDGNATKWIGSSATEALRIQAVYAAGTQTLETLDIGTFTASAVADIGAIRFSVDETVIARFVDSGLELATTTNQILMGPGGANRNTITSPAPAASRTLTIPDAGGNDTFVFLAATQTLTGKSLTAPAITGGTAIELTGLSIRSTGAAFDQLFATATVFTADRTLNFAIGDANRTLTMTGDATLNQDVSTTANPTFGNLTITSFAANWTNAGRTVADGGILTTVDINGGTLDGVSIGATTPAAAIVSTLSVTGTDIILDSDAAAGLTGTLRFTAGAAAAVITLPQGTGTLYSTVASSISSAQLLSSLSDETGTGLAVFNANAVLTAPTITGGTAIELTGLSIRSTGAAFDQLFATATVFTADRTLNFAIGDANRTLTMTGDATLNQDVSTTANPTFGNLTITSFAANWTNAGRTVADAGILTTVDINGGSVDGAIIGGAAAAAVTGTTIDATTDFTIGSLVITSNILTATGRLTTAMTVPTVGTGFDGAALALWAMKGRVGAAGPVISEFIFDLTNLVNSTTAADIIGETATANCHMGQITAVVQGTIQAIEIVCLENPAGGDPDIDFYSAVEATGTENALVTDLTETLLFARGAAWANGDVRGVTTVPAANEYLYLAVGSAGGAPGTYTAGKFKITFYGTV